MNLFLFVSVLTASFTGNAMELIVLKNGTEIIGEVTAVTDDSLTIKYSHNGAPVAATLRRDALDPHSWVVQRSASAGGDARARLDLARFSSDNGLFAFAERELSRAGESDPGLASEVDAERKRARGGAAQSLLALGREALTKGDLDRAYRLGSMAMTRYRDGVTGDAGIVLLDEIELARAAQAERETAEAKAAASAALVEERAALVRPAREQMEQARKRSIAGLHQDDLSGALTAFESAAKRYRAASRLADDVAMKHGNDAALLTLVDEVRREALSGAVQAHVNMGSLYVVRGSFVKALNHANEALATNPDDAYAQSFRARVEIASAQAGRSRGRISVR